jgi:hypothetical protein
MKEKGRKHQKINLAQTKIREQNARMNARMNE